MGKLSKKSGVYKVFPADGGFRVIGRQGSQQVALLEAMGALRPEYDRTSGELLGYRVVGAETNRVDIDLRSIRTTASISAHEMQMNVVRSRTYGLGELDRLTRIKNGEPPEDEAERVQAKVRVYPVVTAAKGDVLRAWPR